MPRDAPCPSFMPQLHALDLAASLTCCACFVVARLSGISCPKLPQTVAGSDSQACPDSLSLFDIMLHRELKQLTRPSRLARLHTTSYRRMHSDSPQLWETGGATSCQFGQGVVLCVDISLSVLWCSRILDRCGWFTLILRWGFFCATCVADGS